ncbi:MAG: multiheme c-type cytochrome [Verrucomicrobia bacterium]|nr:multiheme c-type cytochrome [Verrucomicrobiota bacterium]
MVGTTSRSERRGRTKVISIVAAVYGCSVIVLGILGCQQEKSASQQSGGYDAAAPATEVSNRPLETLERGYVSSTACRDCHRDEHNAWATSWHRTMTQVVTPETVAGRFDGAEMEFYGWKFRPENRDGKFWFHIEGTQSNRKFDHELVMMTGSHSMQKYWYSTGNGRELGMVPMVYVFEAERWMPEHSAFLRPTEPGLAVRKGDWNNGCNQCHATGSQPRLHAPEGIDTRVAEFGISCEACHGPGEQHIVEMRARENAPQPLSPSPLSSDLFIVHPANLSAKRSAQICGQCHGAWVMKKFAGSDWANIGHHFRPGDDLDDTRHYIQGEGDVHLQEQVKAEDSFWPDGQIRVTGREYNGLIGSPCFNHDKDDSKRMTCTSCHDMHASTTVADKTWANDQLGKGLDGNAACFQCHDSYRENLVQHTHHPPDSSGSNCYNCHMPHTSYGLLKAVRSHTITSPSVAESLATGRPNACNQCHLDQTLEWSAQKLNEFYGQEVPALTQDQSTVAASILWMLKGDAGQRALMAWSLGWQEAQQASATHWMPFFLTDLMFDDYDAVRYIAHRSLRSIPAFSSVEFDHMKPHGQYDRIMTEIMSIWMQSVGDQKPTDSKLLFDETGNPRMDIYGTLRSLRDNRRVIITE